MPSFKTLCFLPCLQAVQQTCYDVLLLDLRMPRMNGVEAATHIAHEVPPQRQPRWIFALTADMLGSVEGPCRDAGEGFQQCMQSCSGPVGLCCGLAWLARLHRTQAPCEEGGTPLVGEEAHGGVLHHWSLLLWSCCPALLTRLLSSMLPSTRGPHRHSLTCSL